MAVSIQQDGTPYLPDPDEKKYPNLKDEDELRKLFGELVNALREYFGIQKTDADALSAQLAAPGLAGTKVYYVSDTSGGAVTRKLTFIAGILTAET